MTLCNCRDRCNGACCPGTTEYNIPADTFTVNFMRLAGLDKTKARLCEVIARLVLAQRGTAALPSTKADQEEPK